MKIALISLEVGLNMQPPIGLAYLATYIERKLGYRDTIIIDGNLEDIHGKVREIRPDFIGISSMSLRYGKAIKVAREIRGYSKAIIAIGGVHISTLPQSFNEVFDFGVCGEGEETFRDVAAHLLEKGTLSREDLAGIPGLVYKDGDGDIKFTPPRPPIRDIDDIPHPDMSYINPVYFKPREEVGLKMVAPCAPVFTARGCPYRCVFCSTASFWGRYRRHSLPYVVDNIRYLYENFGVRIINVKDDLFIVDKKRLVELTELLEDNRLLGKVVFTSTARSNLIDDEMCGILKRLNVKNLNFGFESGSDRMLKYLKVGSTSVEKNKLAIATCKKHGLAVYGSVMFGCPGETIEDMHLTLDFIDYAKKAGADYIWAFVATPFPQTEFWEEAKKRGKVSEEMDWEGEDILSLHGSVDNPPLSDADPVEFGKIFTAARSKLRGMRYRLLLRFVLNSPLAAVRLFVRNIPYYIRRIYYYVFRF